MGWGSFFKKILKIFKVAVKIISIPLLVPLSVTKKVIDGILSGDIGDVLDALNPLEVMKEINNLLPDFLKFYADGDSRGTYIAKSSIVKEFNEDTGYYEFIFTAITYSSSTSNTMTVRITKDGYSVLNNKAPLLNPSVFELLFNRDDLDGLGTNLVYDDIYNGDFIGIHQYRLSYVDVNGIETSSGEATTSISSFGGGMRIIIPLPTAGGVDSVNLYRKSTLTNIPSSYLLVGNYTLTEFGGTPSILTVIDNLHIDDLGKIMPQDTLTEVPHDLLYITSFNGRLFGATKGYTVIDYIYQPTVSDPYPLGTYTEGDIVTFKELVDFELPDGNILTIGDAVQYNGLTWEYRPDGHYYQDFDHYYTLMYSEVGQPNTWKVLNFINFEHSISGIGSTANGLVVYTEFDSFLLMGTSSESFERRMISNSYGCISHKSIQSWKGSSISASDEGIVITDGGSAELVSYDKLGLMDLRGQVLGSAIVGSSYFLLLVTNRIIRFDLEDNIFLELEANSAVGIGKFRTDLYIIDSGRIMNRLDFRYAGGANYSYTSGKITEGSIGNLKEYDKVRVNVEGRHFVTVIIDGISVIKNAKVITGVQTIGIPNEGNKGYYIQFQLSGVGSVHSIEYSVKGRDNG